MKIKRRTLLSFATWSIRLSIVTILVGGIYLYFFSQFFTITRYDIYGVDDGTRSRVDSQLQIGSQKKLYKIFPNNKIFTYSNSSIIESVRSIVPEISSVTLRPVGLHTVKVEITVLEPLFTISGSEKLTGDGIIFNTATTTQNLPYITIASSTTKIITRNGLEFKQLVVSDEEDSSMVLNNIAELSSKISSVIFPVASIIVDETGDVTYKDSRGMSKLFFQKDTDIKKSWSTLVSAIDTDPLKSKLSQDKENLEYLDVRYGNKVFYRFSDMSSTGTGQHASSTVIIDNHENSQASSTISH